jgi:hypothetical protein
MSKPAMPRSETPPLPTRRQLDELDALLQRMLELPVNHAADAGLAQDEPSEVDAPPFTETSAWTSRWEESASSSERDLAPIAPAPAESPAEWRSRWTPTEEATTNLPDSHRVELPPLPAEKAHSPHETPDPQEWEKIIDGPANASTEEPSAEYGQPRHMQIQPPPLLVVLGWLGLLCLFASLALLAYDWFGWTW